MIPVNEPLITKTTIAYSTDAVKSGWISSAGKYLNLFEEEFAQFLDVKYASAVSNGTTALHLALSAAGVREGDEVIMPDLTIISCAFSAMYLGAKPVLVDVDPTTGNIDPSLIESKISKKTKVIMVVHLFGQPVDMDPILELAKKHNLMVIEDAAEAHGALYKGKKVGSIGDIGCFSFYANKIITSGEGGMVVTNNKAIHSQVQLQRNLSHVPGKRFFHEMIGFNYRLTNIQAAVGLASLRDVSKSLEKKNHIAQLYNKLLHDIPHLKLPSSTNYGTNVYWMYNIEVMPSSPVDRNEMMDRLSKQGVETRTYFYPLHEQPVLSHYSYNQQEFPETTRLSKNGFYLPSGLTLTDKQIKEVCAAVKLAIEKKS